MIFSLFHKIWNLDFSFGFNFSSIRFTGIRETLFNDVSVENIQASQASDERLNASATSEEPSFVRDYGPSIFKFDCVPAHIVLFTKANNLQREVQETMEGYKNLNQDEDESELRKVLRSTEFLAYSRQSKANGYILRHRKIFQVSLKASILQHSRSRLRRAWADDKNPAVSDLKGVKIVDLIALPEKISDLLSFHVL